ncbi:MAG: hypothetical protein RLZZ28_1775 [Bacteroidota bacterium]|jgi:GNAT superfamily N-acetyltransferase
MPNKEDFEAAGFQISTDKAKLDTGVIHHYLSVHSYWAQSIPLGLVQTSIENSYCFGLFYREEQIGFARLVTDKATFAYLADVFVLPAFRGRGLSKWLIQTIHADPALQGLRRWMLATKDAHGLYAQFGWKPVPEEMAGRFMQLHNPDLYQNPGPATEN